VALVACEDTRQSSKLMDAAAAARPLLSLHEHNERDRIDQLVTRLATGEDIALISDAGTPLVSDPGYRLVSAVIDAGHAVVPIPGPSAVLAALAASGIATDAFSFIGFLPHKSAARQKLLEQWAAIPATLIFFESPHRILESLAQIATLFPQRQMAAARELTKLHEEILRGTAGEIHAQLAARPAIKGEFTLVLERGSENERLNPEETLAAMVARLQAEGVPRMDAIKQAAKALGLGKREAYDQLERAK
jgi:16S rRNA (cytidine1402-2'-O)-methyltransferase